MATHDEIAACAYLIYIDEGRPAGQEERHWRQARTQLAAMEVHDFLLDERRSSEAGAAVAADQSHSSSRFHESNGDRAHSPRDRGGRQNHPSSQAAA